MEKTKILKGFAVIITRPALLVVLGFSSGVLAIFISALITEVFGIREEVETSVSLALVAIFGGINLGVSLLNVFWFFERFLLRFIFSAIQIAISITAFVGGMVLAGRILGVIL